MSGPRSPQPFVERALKRLRGGADHLWRLLSNAISRFSLHRCTQLAASMAYYALFSIFPAAIVLAAAAGFILNDPGAREDVVSYLLKELPLTSDQGRSDIETVLDGVTANSGTLGLIGGIGLLITASALISAARNALNVIFADQIRRGAIRGKALDVLLVLGLGSLITVSFAATLIGQLDVTLHGRIGAAIDGVLSAAGAVLALGLTAFVFSVLYRVLPTSRPGLRDIWPGVVFASVGYEILKRGFSFYLDKFANYSAVYGSLGAVIAFMFFVWLASVVFLLGAEMAAVWPGVRAGEFDPDPDEEGEPFLHQVRDTLLGLFRRNRIERR